MYMYCRSGVTFISQGSSLDMRFDGFSRRAEAGTLPDITTQKVTTRVSLFLGTSIVDKLVLFGTARTVNGLRAY